MFNNAQKRSGGGLSLNKASLVVSQAVTAGQDLYISEAGDVAPSNWFTGTPVFLDNTDPSFAGYVAGNSIPSCDIASFNNEICYSARVLKISPSNGVATCRIYLSMFNPLTGKTIASANVAISDPIVDNQAQTLSCHVVPISATQFGVMYMYQDTSYRYVCRQAKFTLNGETFDAEAWSASLVTTAASDSGQAYAVEFAVLTGGTPRIFYCVRQLTSTTSVVIIYNAVAGTITTVTLTYAIGGKSHVSWFLLEGTNTICSLEGALTASNLRYVKQDGTTGFSSSVNLSSLLFNTVKSVVAISPTVLIVSGATGATNSTVRNTTKLFYVTVSTDLTSIAVGNSYTIPASWHGYGDGEYGVMAYAAGTLYLHSVASRARCMRYPAESKMNNPIVAQLRINSKVMSMKVTAAVANLSTIELVDAPVCLAIDFHPWEAAETRKMRCIYSPYYRLWDRSNGFVITDKQNIVTADVPWVYMPELVYALGSNGLAYVGSSLENKAAGQVAEVVLPINTVKLNGNLTPVKSMRNGVIAVSTLYGVKLPKGQRNAGILDVIATGVTTGLSFDGMTGTNATGYASEGYMNEFKDKIGQVDIVLEGTASSNESSGTTTVHAVAFVDGRPLELSVPTRQINRATGTKGPMRISIAFTDCLFFAYTPGHANISGSEWVFNTNAQISSAKLEDKYYE